jgi:ABC-2 type transport system permease protein
VQALVIYLIALALGVPIRWEPAAIAGVLMAVIIGSAIFATFSLIMACIVKTRERFMGIGQVLTMPLFFASNAIYPLTLMPPWLRRVAQLNPLTYLVDVLRGLMVVGGQSAYPLSWDYGLLLGVFLFLMGVAVRLYPRLGE